MYEVLVWDYDEELGYYVVERRSSLDLIWCKNYAFEKADPDEGHYVGAGVFRDGNFVHGYGFTLAYVPKPKPATTKIPRLVVFDAAGKAIAAGNPANAIDGTKIVIDLPTDHYDFIGPIDVKGKTLEEIQAEILTVR